MSETRLSERFQSGQPVEVNTSSCFLSKSCCSCTSLSMTLLGGFREVPGSSFWNALRKTEWSRRSEEMLEVACTGLSGWLYSFLASSRMLAVVVMGVEVDAGGRQRGSRRRTSAGAAMREVRWRFCWKKLGEMGHGGKWWTSVLGGWKFLVCGGSRWSSGCCRGGGFRRDRLSGFSTETSELVFYCLSECEKSTLFSMKV